MGNGTAERFDIERGVSETLPNMKEKRNGAASCALNGSVYVFFGQDDSQEPISNYEKLQGADGPAARARFVLCQPNITIIGRWFPAVSAINDNTIAIMGGMGVIDDEDSCLGDVYVFST